MHAGKWVGSDLAFRKNFWKKTGISIKNATLNLMTSFRATKLVSGCKLAFFCCLYASFLHFLPAGLAQNSQKTIHLRNERITTEPAAPKKGIQAQSISAPLNGLFIVQFDGSFQQGWAQELATLNVKLIRFVPEDAFIARFTSVSLQKVKALPFVRWVGPYKAAYKLDGALSRILPMNQEVSVRILLSPEATREEALLAKRNFRGGIHERSFSFGTILQGSVPPNTLGTLAESSGVLWIEPATKMKLQDEIATKTVVGNDGQAGTFAALHQQGIDGRGVTVAVADSGLDNGTVNVDHPDLAGRVDATLFYGELLDASDEHGHGTHVAGIVAGNGATGETDEDGFLYGLGVAPGAHIVGQRIFDGDGNYTLNDDFNLLTRDALKAGAVIGSNSWGDDTQGQYNLNAAQFDALVRDADNVTPGDQPYILEFSAGNAGPGSLTIGSPAVAKNVIATGASQNDRFGLFIYEDGHDAMADFSSRGPCIDGRIKPDVVAPGTWISSLQSSAATDENAWLPISNYYQYEGGTSQAGPHASGAAALFVQYYRQTHGGQTPSPAMVKAALINSAVDMDDTVETGPVPNNDEGWGRIDLTQIINSNVKHVFVDQTVLLATGKTNEQRIIVGSDRVPLKVTLAYTDVPGVPFVIPELVNDLDLQVIDPDGHVYKGNEFLEGESIRDAAAADRVNNVEGVLISNPTPGEYIVRVIAHAVSQDSRKDTPVVDQDFALVISAEIPNPGQGVLLMDRAKYTVPGVISLTLIDFDLAGQQTANVVIRSSTETAGEVVTLKASPTVAGIFRGTITTAAGVAVADGKLQIKHQDEITAVYADALPKGDRTAVASADLQGPVISNVSVNNRFGQAVILWNTDEPATSFVRYGTGGNFNLSSTNSDLVEQHELGLTNLVADSDYRFYVVSADEAGNLTTNNNNGAYFEFKAPSPASVLLVGADDPLLEIPLSFYSDALAETGVTFDVWNIDENGSPTLADIKPYRTVFWRILEFDFVGLTADEQTTIRNYLKGGGALMIASMELLSRMDSSPSFRSEVLQVQDFTVDATVPGITGIEFDSISNGMDMALDYSAFVALEPLGQTDFSDTFTPSTNAIPIFLDYDTGKPCGLKYPRVGKTGDGRLVFLSFPLEAVPTDGENPNNRATLLRNCLNFLAPGERGFGSITMDQGSYKIPAVVNIEVADSDLIGQRQITVQVTSTTNPSGITLPLYEVGQRGLFQGSAAVVRTPAAANQLKVSAGDKIRAIYVDGPARVVVEASALIDTVPPKISDVESQAEYAEAVVVWQTDEDADALVQFGESTFLGRTAYSSEFSIDHELRLEGLNVDQLYYYQVVSRDAAGNTVVDDNHGQFYTFHTLLPLTLPWVDHLEGAVTNWVTQEGQVDGETGVAIGETIWELGTPQNGLENAAHSGTNAWCSNIEGRAIGASDTSLISPAINLTGGNVVTLSFWQSYDFSELSENDIYEYGEVYISTNSGRNWNLLAQYGDLTGGWEEATIDLSAYIGNVVRLGWYYGMFTLEEMPRPGWIIDDISITYSNATRGTITITNNLAKSSYAITGPLAISGHGWSKVVTNAAAGDYTIKYDPVPYYTTPADQTKTLTTGGTIQFSGMYSFPDVNNNGISDLWEQEFFNAVDPNPNPRADHDGDGASDAVEFVSGTDPNKPDSNFMELLPEFLSNGRVKISWKSVAGNAYRIIGSTDLRSWIAYSEWISATDLQSSVIIPGLSGSAQYFFKVEVRP